MIRIGQTFYCEPLQQVPKFIVNWALRDSKVTIGDSDLKILKDKGHVSIKEYMYGKSRK